MESSPKEREGGGKEKEVRLLTPTLTIDAGGSESSHRPLPSLLGKCNSDLPPLRENVSQKARRTYSHAKANSPRLRQLSPRASSLLRASSAASVPLAKNSSAGKRKALFKGPPKGGLKGMVQGNAQHLFRIEQGPPRDGGDVLPAGTPLQIVKYLLTAVPADSVQVHRFFAAYRSFFAPQELLDSCVTLFGDAAADQERLCRFIGIWVSTYYSRDVDSRLERDLLKVAIRYPGRHTNRLKLVMLKLMTQHMSSDEEQRQEGTEMRTLVRKSRTGAGPGVDMHRPLPGQVYSDQVKAARSEHGTELSLHAGLQEVEVEEGKDDEEEEQDRKWEGGDTEVDVETWDGSVVHAKLDDHPPAATGRLQRIDSVVRRAEVMEGIEEDTTAKGLWDCEDDVDDLDEGDPEDANRGATKSVRYNLPF